MINEPCAKCGIPFNDASVLIQNNENGDDDWLCDKCNKKWDKLVKENWDKKEWIFNFDKAWTELWDKFVQAKEKVIFT